MLSHDYLEKAIGFIEEAQIENTGGQSDRPFEDLLLGAVLSILQAAHARSGESLRELKAMIAKEEIHIPHKDRFPPSYRRG